MRRSILVAAILASLAFAAQAREEIELSFKTKALVSAAVVAKPVDAPLAAGRGVISQLPMLEGLERRDSRAGCESTGRDLCYDAADGRIAYRGARGYMPKLDGMTAENVSLHRNRIVFKYSFR